MQAFKLRNDNKKNEYNITFPQSVKNSLPHKIFPILIKVIFFLKIFIVLITLINAKR